MSTVTDRDRHHVVVVGAGFGGLETVRGLARAPVRITVIDSRNHHLFQPLLYQVATASLATSDVAWPIRRLLRRRGDVTTLLATVTGVDMARRQVTLRDGGSVDYDTLVVATGARHAYFGHDEWAPHAPGLKTIEDATTIRRRLLLAFEHAERESDPARRRALLTFVIVGAGPTGVELAGTIAELAHRHLRPDFRRIDTRDARILLVEAGPRVLPTFDPTLSDYSQRALERLGVDVHLGEPVSECAPGCVVFGGRRIDAAVTIWAAGVQASAAADWLGAARDKADRVQVAPDLTVPGHPEVFVIGDTALVPNADGRPVPGIAPAAKQQGGYVAHTIRQRLGGATAVPPFRYRHHGSLATIGRRAAVIERGRFKLKGWLAWWIWGVAHIYFLIGVRNRLAVALNWLWMFTRGERAARLITQGDQPARPDQPPT
ncbi:MAG: NAD(P)/FAD-dependent oxidoreductase [Pseudomonadota bacterium]